VQAYQPDGNGGVSTTLGTVVIALGSAGRPVPTSLVTMEGQLNADGPLAASGNVLTAAMNTAAGTPATGTTQLTALVDDNGIPLFATGDEVSVVAHKGGIAMPEASLVVAPTPRP